MTPDADLTADQLSVIGKVEKLLRLAGKNPNEAEAAAASAKAMELLEAYSLDMSTVEKNSGDAGKRTEEKLIGGFYEFERDLWARIAELNFCWYWSQHTRVWVTKRDEKAYDLLAAAHGVREDGKPKYPTWEMQALSKKKKLKNQHRLVGRVVNVKSTIAMAGYILGAVERLTRERLAVRVHWDPTSQFKTQAQAMNAQLWSRWAVSYREGIAQRVAEKLYDRRQSILAEEKARKEEAHRRMSEAAGGTALTLADVREAEEQGNYDFLYGEGAWARQQAEIRRSRAERAQKQAVAEAEYTAWAAAHPEEARKEEAKREKEARKRSARSYRPKAEKARDWGAYRAGYEAGDKIGLDVQAEGTKVAGVL